MARRLKVARHARLAHRRLEAGGTQPREEAGFHARRARDARPRHRRQLHRLQHRQRAAAPAPAPGRARRAGRDAPFHAQDPARGLGGLDALLRGPRDIARATAAAWRTWPATSAAASRSRRAASRSACAAARSRPTSSRCSACSRCSAATSGEEDAADFGFEPVVLLSHRLFERRFGARPAASSAGAWSSTAAPSPSSA